MRIPQRRPRRHTIFVPQEADLDAVAERAIYVGSVEHKTYSSEAGMPRPRADATKCDQERHGNFRELTRMLRTAIASGRVGAPWEGDFPRYAWGEEDGDWFEARLVNRELGTYKGYGVSLESLPEGL
jgi:hypothetical protein